MPELQVHLVLADSYDREAFRRAVRGIPQVEKLRASGGRLLPHFEPLLEDLFAALFKLVVRLRPEAESPTSTRLSRRTLEAVLGSPGFAALKEETALDAARAAEAAIGLAERVLALVRSGELLTEEELFDALALARAEQELDRDRRAVESTKPTGAAIARFLEQKTRQEEERAEGLARRMLKVVGELPPVFDAALSRRRRRSRSSCPRAARRPGASPRGCWGGRLETARSSSDWPNSSEAAKRSGSSRRWRGPFAPRHWPRGASAGSGPPRRCTPWGSARTWATCSRASCFRFGTGFAARTSCGATSRRA